MTDKPKPEIADAIQVHACEVGHVHMTFLREDGSEIAVAILEIEEALTHARAMVRMALKAYFNVGTVTKAYRALDTYATVRLRRKESAESAPGVVGGDVEKHTKH